MTRVVRSVAAGLIAVAASAHADPLIFDNGRVFITARMNGVRTEALLDSAAEATLVDEAFAARIKLPQGTPQTIRGSGGTASARIVEGVTITALGIDLHPEAVVVTDLTELSKRLIKRRTDLILGRELFDAERLRIDLVGRRITVASRAIAPRGKKLPLTAHAGVEAIPVVAAGHIVQAEFDLGNGSGVLISRALANRLGLKSIGSRSGGGIGGEVKRELVMIPVLRIAGISFRAVVSAIDDQPNANDLNIGTSILKHFVITTDFKQRAVWLVPNRR
jgi:predicted aspartyl protease